MTAAERQQGIAPPPSDGPPSRPAYTGPGGFAETNQETGVSFPINSTDALYTGRVATGSTVASPAVRPSRSRGFKFLGAGLALTAVIGGGIVAWGKVGPGHNGDTSTSTGPLPDGDPGDNPDGISNPGDNPDNLQGVMFEQPQPDMDFDPGGPDALDTLENRTDHPHFLGAVSAILGGGEVTDDGPAQVHQFGYTKHFTTGSGHAYDVAIMLTSGEFLSSLDAKVASGELVRLHGDIQVAAGKYADAYYYDPKTGLTHYISNEFTFKNGDRHATVVTTQISGGKNGGPYPDIVNDRMAFDQDLMPMRILRDLGTGDN